MQDVENAGISIFFFSKAVKNLKILGFEEVDTFPEKISYPIFATVF